MSRMGGGGVLVIEQVAVLVVVEPGVRIVVDGVASC